LRNLAKGLARKRHKICPTVVGNLLRELGYSLQANSKTREGTKHIDRDVQFRYINTQATAFLTAGEPVISVDTKNKELVGNYKNNGWQGREPTPTGQEVKRSAVPTAGPKLAAEAAANAEADAAKAGAFSRE
jgi:hypothetical protein